MRKQIILNAIGWRESLHLDKIIQKIVMSKKKDLRLITHSDKIPIQAHY